MLKINYHMSFKKDYKKARKRGLDMSAIHNVINMLANEVPLPVQYKDHALKGEYIGYRECHVQNDWLLIYKIEEDILTLTLAYMGTHSDLF
ncbi:MAG: type II toxin-antitoxin system YafQ family toxin [Ruminococcus sp.]|nr:type II toxin-antitoxin system YafQ family toxin [Ruminococcus sp.]